MDTTTAPAYTDLRKPGTAGHTSRIYLTIKGRKTGYWYHAEDPARAIKMLEQQLHDDPPEGRDLWSNLWRSLWLASDGYGLLSIGDSPEAAVSGMPCQSAAVVLRLDNAPSRTLAGTWLGADLGQYGTQDLPD